MPKASTAAARAEGAAGGGGEDVGPVEEWAEALRQWVRA